MVIDNKGTSISFLFSNLNEMKDFINLICSWNWKCRYHLAFLKLFIYKQDVPLENKILEWEEQF